MAHAGHRFGLGLFAAATLILLAASPAEARGGYGGELGDDHAVVFGMSAAQLRELGSKVRGGVAASATGPWWEYAATSYCNFLPPGQVDGDVSCTQAWTVCTRGADDPAAGGPAVHVWGRLVNAAGEPVDEAGVPVAGDGWQRVGFTCLPQLVPGAGNVLTMADVLRQFHDTPFAKAEVSVQPVGGVTLVNLPTYFEAAWRSEGFGPGEVDATVLVGRAVEIRPRVKHVEFFFGDGTTSGPTTSLGGPYPDGDIVYTYRTASRVQVRADVTYGGEFRVDGGEWMEIPGTARVVGVPFALRVAEAKARLYTN